MRLIQNTTTAKYPPPPPPTSKNKQKTHTTTAQPSALKRRAEFQYKHNGYAHSGSSPSDFNPAIWGNIKRRSFTARVNATSNFRRKTWRCKLTNHFGADSVALGTGFFLYSPRVFCPHLYLAANNAAIMTITTKNSTRK